MLRARRVSAPASPRVRGEGCIGELADAASPKGEGKGASQDEAPLGKPLTLSPHAGRGERNGAVAPAPIMQKRPDRAFSRQVDLCSSGCRPCTSPPTRAQIFF